MKYQAKGKVEVIGKTQSFGTNGFTKREIVINMAEDGAKYPSHAVIEFVKDKCTMLDGIPKGANVTVDFFIDAREYNGRWFSSLKGFKIAVEGGAPAPAPAEPEYIMDDGASDDMPF